MSSNIASWRYELNCARVGLGRCRLSPTNSILTLLFCGLLGVTEAKGEESDNGLFPFVGMKAGYQFGLDQRYRDRDPNGALAGAFAGLHLSPSWRWELGYQYHDKLVADATGVAVKTQLLESGFRYDWYWHENFALYGRLGAAYWQMDKERSGAAGLSDRGVSPLVGLGLHYQLTPTMGLSAGYQYLDAIGSSATGRYDSHATVLELSYRFGLARPPQSGHAPAPSNPTVSQPISPLSQSESVPPLQRQPLLHSKVQYQVTFESDRADFSSPDTADWWRLVTLLRQYPQAKAMLVGHTDATGSTPYNLELSQRRAEAVARALVVAGVAGDQLRVDGEGESSPIASNATPAGRAQNRRVELIIDEFEYQQEADTND
ncbi:OmpA family protein [Ferrimonas balearica]|uniref:OmpA family protein n=1 Tax=Ferrimonas balearica TaxID=44012 RepID=UPI001C55BA42|nr:OmpA family protein [Ferrimonas balearica]MBW3140791.1 OmpA family protein [Ferrimonas balearica]